MLVSGSVCIWPLEPDIRRESSCVILSWRLNTVTQSDIMRSLFVVTEDFY